MHSAASYRDLLERKRVAFEPRGIEPPSLNAAMFPHQASVTEFLLRAGCGAAFLDTGLGKSLIALEWGRIIAAHAGKPVLMLAPLAVGQQHAREAGKFGIEAAYLREPTGKALPPVVITNYERIHLWRPGDFAGVVLDESSILKSFAGKTKQALLEAFNATPYRLACTATPAPNDHMELGNHGEFLGIMPSNEMLSRWFITDQTQMGRYRLKKPAVKSFWDWVASWSRCVSQPSDIGHSDEGFVLPEMIERNHIVAADLTIDAGISKGGQVMMFRAPEMSATSVHREKKLTLEGRADAIAAVAAAESNEPWIVWVDTDAEADAMLARMPDAIEVRGSMKPEMKESRLVAFSDGNERVLITKPSIAGFGLNWQHCARMGFVSRNFSYEAYYQAVRRSWRFGQRRPVHVHSAMASTEQPILEAYLRKAGDHEGMKTEMRGAMTRAMRTHRIFEDYQPVANVALPEWLRSAA